jgi:protein-tyrosine phosphatase
MRAELFPIPICPAGRLAIMPRPRAGDWLEEEVASWRQQGLDVVVSLLDDDEVAELGLGDEAALCQRADIRFCRFPIADRGEPASTSSVTHLVADLIAELRAGRYVGIHCRIGVGRSASLSACVLGALGVPLDQAWTSIQQARGVPVPDTPAQREWVARWVALTPREAARNPV